MPTESAGEDSTQSRLAEPGEAAGGRTRVQRVALDREGIERVAEGLGATVDLAPFRLPGGAVYQLLVAGGDGRPATLLTLWPSIERVDAVGAGATAVFTRIASVDLVEGIEVIFRRQGGEMMIVAVGGKIIVRA